MAKKKDDYFDASDDDFDSMLDKFPGDIDDFNPDSVDGADKDRNPVASKLKSINSSIMKSGDAFLEGSGIGIGKAIERDFPNIKQTHQAVTDIMSEIQTFRREAAEQIVPFWNQTKRTLRKIGTQLEGQLPLGLDKKILKLAGEEETSSYRNASQKEIRREQIHSNIDEIFRLQQEKSIEQKRDNILQHTLDRRITNIHHKENATFLAKIAESVGFNQVFTSTVFTNYLKKDLELKYKQFYATEDILGVMTNHAKAVDTKLDAVIKNTALPDADKIYMSERVKANLKNKFSNTISDKVSNYFAEIRKKAMDSIKSIIDNSSMLLMPLDMLADFNEMGKEFGMGGQRFSPGGMLASMIFKSLGGAAGNIATHKLSQFLSPETHELLKNVLPGSGREGIVAMLDMVKNGTIDVMEPFGSILRPILQNFAPDLGKTNYSIVNDAWENRNEAGKITNKFIKTVEDVIPGYLRMQTKYLEQIATGNSKAEERFWDYKNEQFITRSAHDKLVNTGLYKDEDARRLYTKDRASDTVRLLQTSTASTNTINPEYGKRLDAAYRKYWREIELFKLNLAHSGYNSQVHDDWLNQLELIKEAKDPKLLADSSLYQDGFEGIKNYRIVAEFWHTALKNPFNPTEFNKVARNQLNKLLFEEKARRFHEVKKDSLYELKDRFGPEAINMLTSRDEYGHAVANAKEIAAKHLEKTFNEKDLTELSEDERKQYDKLYNKKDDIRDDALINTLRDIKETLKQTDFKGYAESFMRFFVKLAHPKLSDTEIDAKINKGIEYVDDKYQKAKTKIHDAKEKVKGKVRQINVSLAHKTLTSLDYKGSNPIFGSLRDILFVKNDKNELILRDLNAIDESEWYDWIACNARTVKRVANVLNSDTTSGSLLRSLLPNRIRQIVVMLNNNPAIIDRLVENSSLFADEKNAATRRGINAKIINEGLEGLRGNLDRSSSKLALGNLKLYEQVEIAPPKKDKPKDKPKDKSKDTDKKDKSDKKKVCETDTLLTQIIDSIKATNTHLTKIIPEIKAVNTSTIQVVSEVRSTNNCAKLVDINKQQNVTLSKIQSTLHDFYTAFLDPQIRKERQMDFINTRIDDQINEIVGNINSRRPKNITSIRDSMRTKEIDKRTANARVHLRQLADAYRNAVDNNWGDVQINRAYRRFKDYAKTVGNLTKHRATNTFKEEPISLISGTRLNGASEDQIMEAERSSAMRQLRPLVTEDLKNRSIILYSLASLIISKADELLANTKNTLSYDDIFINLLNLWINEIKNRFNFANKITQAEPLLEILEKETFPSLERFFFNRMHQYKWYHEVLTFMSFFLPLHDKLMNATEATRNVIMNDFDPRNIEGLGHFTQGEFDKIENLADDHPRRQEFVTTAVSLFHERMESKIPTIRKTKNFHEESVNPPMTEARYNKLKYLHTQYPKKVRDSEIVKQIRREERRIYKHGDDEWQDDFESIPLFSEGDPAEYFRFHTKEGQDELHNTYRTNYKKTQTYDSRDDNPFNRHIRDIENGEFTPDKEDRQDEGTMTVVDAIVHALRSMQQVFAKTFNAVIADPLSKATKAGYNAGAWAANKVLGGYENAINTATDPLDNLGIKLWFGAQRYGYKANDAIHKAPQTWQAAKDYANQARQQMFNNAGATPGNANDTTTSFWNNDWNRTKGDFNSATGAVANFFSNDWNQTKGDVYSATGAVSNFFSNDWNQTKADFNSAKKKVSDIKTDAIDYVKLNGFAAHDLGVSTKNAVSNFFSNDWKQTKGDFNSAANAVANAGRFDWDRVAANARNIYDPKTRAAINGLGSYANNITDISGKLGHYGSTAFDTSPQMPYGSESLKSSTNGNNSFKSAYTPSSKRDFKYGRPVWNNWRPHASRYASGGNYDNGIPKYLSLLAGTDVSKLNLQDYRKHIRLLNRLNDKAYRDRRDDIFNEIIQLPYSAEYMQLHQAYRGLTSDERKLGKTGYYNKLRSAYKLQAKIDNIKDKKDLEKYKYKKQLTLTNPYKLAEFINSLTPDEQREFMVEMQQYSRESGPRLAKRLQMLPMFRSSHGAMVENKVPLFNLKRYNTFNKMLNADDRSYLDASVGPIASSISNSRLAGLAEGIGIFVNSDDILKGVLLHEFSHAEHPDAQPSIDENLELIHNPYAGHVKHGARYEKHADWNAVKMMLRDGDVQGVRDYVDCLNQSRNTNDPDDEYDAGWRAKLIGRATRRYGYDLNEGLDHKKYDFSVTPKPQPKKKGFFAKLKDKLRNKFSGIKKFASGLHFTMDDVAQLPNGRFLFKDPKGIVAKLIDKINDTIAPIKQRYTRDREVVSILHDTFGDLPSNINLHQLSYNAMVSPNADTPGGKAIHNFLGLANECELAQRVIEKLPIIDVTDYYRRWYDISPDVRIIYPGISNTEINYYLEHKDILPKARWYKTTYYGEHEYYDVRSIWKRETSVAHEPLEFIPYDYDLVIYSKRNTKHDAEIKDKSLSIEMATVRENKDSCAIPGLRPNSGIVVLRGNNPEDLYYTVGHELGHLQDPKGMQWISDKGFGDEAHKGKGYYTERHADIYGLHHELERIARTKRKHPQLAEERIKQLFDTLFERYASKSSYYSYPSGNDNRWRTDLMRRYMRMGKHKGNPLFTDLPDEELKPKFKGRYFAKGENFDIPKKKGFFARLKDKLKNKFAKGENFNAGSFIWDTIEKLHKTPIKSHKRKRDDDNEYTQLLRSAQADLSPDELNEVKTYLYRYKYWDIDQYPNAGKITHMMRRMHARKSGYDRLKALIAWAPIIDVTKYFKEYYDIPDTVKIIDLEISNTEIGYSVEHPEATVVPFSVRKRTGVKSNFAYYKNKKTRFTPVPLKNQPKADADLLHDDEFIGPNSEYWDNLEFERGISKGLYVVTDPMNTDSGIIVINPREKHMISVIGVGHELGHVLDRYGDEYTEKIADSAHKGRGHYTEKRADIYGLIKYLENIQNRTNKGKLIRDIDDYLKDLTKDTIGFNLTDNRWRADLMRRYMRMRKRKGDSLFADIPNSILKRQFRIHNYAKGGNLAYDYYPMYGAMNDDSFGSPDEISFDLPIDQIGGYVDQPTEILGGTGIAGEAGGETIIPHKYNERFKELIYKCLRDTVSENMANRVLGMMNPSKTTTDKLSINLPETNDSMMFAKGGNVATPDKENKKKYPRRHDVKSDRDILLNIMESNEAIYEKLGTGITITGLTMNKDLLRLLRQGGRKVGGFFSDAYNGFKHYGILGGILNLGKVAVQHTAKNVGGLVRHAFTSKMCDVFLRAENENSMHGERLIKASEFANGLIFADKKLTKPIYSVADLHPPVYRKIFDNDEVGYEEAITEAQGDFGLVDEYGNPLVSIGGRIGRYVHNVVAKPFRIIFGDYTKNKFKEGLNAARSAFSGVWDAYCDVYAKNDLNTPLIEGRHFKDGHVVKIVNDKQVVVPTVFDIDAPCYVLEPNDKGVYELIHATPRITEKHLAYNLLVHKDGTPITSTIITRASAKFRRLLDWGVGGVGYLAGTSLSTVGKILGISLTAASAIVKTAATAFRAKNPYIDAFVLDVNNELKPALIGRDIQFGNRYFFTNSKGEPDLHKPVRSAYGIDRPVWDTREGRLAITDEDLKRGVYDKNGFKLTRWRGRSLAGKVFATALGTLGLGVKVTWKLGKNLLKVPLAIVKGIAGILGPGGAAVTEFITQGWNSTIDFFRNNTVSRQDLSEIVGRHLIDIYGFLYRYMPRREYKAGDRDGDGDVDGSYEDYKQQSEEREKRRKEKKVDKDRAEQTSRSANNSANKDKNDDDKNTSFIDDFLMARFIEKTVGKKFRALKNFFKNNTLGKTVGGWATKLWNGGIGKARSLFRGGNLAKALLGGAGKIVSGVGTAAMLITGANYTYKGIKYVATDTANEKLLRMLRFKLYGVDVKYWEAIEDLETDTYDAWSHGRPQGVDRQRLRQFGYKIDFLTGNEMAAGGEKSDFLYQWYVAKFTRIYYVYTDIIRHTCNLEPGEQPRASAIPQIAFVKIKSIMDTNLPKAINPELLKMKLDNNSFRGWLKQKEIDAKNSGLISGKYTSKNLNPDDNRKIDTGDMTDHFKYAWNEIRHGNALNGIWAGIKGVGAPFGKLANGISDMFSTDWFWNETIRTKNEDAWNDVRFHYYGIDRKGLDNRYYDNFVAALTEFENNQVHVLDGEQNIILSDLHDLADRLYSNAILLQIHDRLRDAGVQNLSTNLRGEARSFVVSWYKRVFMPIFGCYATTVRAFTGTEKGDNIVVDDIDKDRRTEALHAFENECKKLLATLASSMRTSTRDFDLLKIGYEGFTEYLRKRSQQDVENMKNDATGMLQDIEDLEDEERYDRMQNQAGADISKGWALIKEWDISKGLSYTLRGARKGISAWAENLGTSAAELFHGTVNSHKWESRFFDYGFLAPDLEGASDFNTPNNIKTLKSLEKDAGVKIYNNIVPHAPERVLTDVLLYTKYLSRVCRDVFGVTKVYCGTVKTHTRKSGALKTLGTALIIEGKNGKITKPYNISSTSNGLQLVKNLLISGLIEADDNLKQNAEDVRNKVTRIVDYISFWYEIRFLPVFYTLIDVLNQYGVAPDNIDVDAIPASKRKEALSKYSQAVKQTLAQNNIRKFTLDGDGFTEYAQQLEDYTKDIKDGVLNNKLSNIAKYYQKKEEEVSAGLSKALTDFAPNSAEISDADIAKIDKNVREATLDVKVDLQNGDKMRKLIQEYNASLLGLSDINQNAFTKYTPAQEVMSTLMAVTKAGKYTPDDGDISDEFTSFVNDVYKYVCADKFAKHDEDRDTLLKRFKKFVLVYCKHHGVIAKPIDSIDDINTNEDYLTRVARAGEYLGGKLGLLGNDEEAYKSANKMLRIQYPKATDRVIGNDPLMRYYGDWYLHVFVPYYRFLVEATNLVLNKPEKSESFPNLNELSIVQARYICSKLRAFNANTGQYANLRIGEGRGIHDFYHTLEERCKAQNKQVAAQHTNAVNTPNKKEGHWWDNLDKPNEDKTNQPDWLRDIAKLRDQEPENGTQRDRAVDQIQQLNSQLLGMGMSGRDLSGSQEYDANIHKSANILPPGTKTKYPKVEQNGTTATVKERQYIWDYLTGMLGLSEVQAAGVMGNMVVESQLAPDIINGIKAAGLCQWLGPRRRALEAYAIQHKLNPFTVEAQMGFLYNELNGSERGAFRALKRQTDISSAALSFMNIYERPSPKEKADSGSKRVQAAKAIYAMFAKNKDSNAATEPTSTAQNDTTSVDSIPQSSNTTFGMTGGNSGLMGGAKLAGGGNNPSAAFGMTGGSNDQSFSPSANLTGAGSDLAKNVNVKSGVNIQGAHPVLKDRFSAMSKEFAQLVGHKPTITSGKRTLEQQAALARKGPGAAKPNPLAPHVAGVAFDASSADMNKADQLGLLKKYGLSRPLLHWKTKAEPWHVEPVEARKWGGKVSEKALSYLNTLAQNGDTAATGDTPSTTLATSSDYETSETAPARNKGSDIVRKAKDALKAKMQQDTAAASANVKAMYTDDNTVEQPPVITNTATEGDNANIHTQDTIQKGITDANNGNTPVVAELKIISGILQAFKNDVSGFINMLRGGINAKASGTTPMSNPATANTNSNNVTLDDTSLKYITEQLISYMQQAGLAGSSSTTVPTKERERRSSLPGYMLQGNKVYY